MKVLITRPVSQSGSFAEALQRAGFETSFLPVIEIRPAEDLSDLDEAVREIETYDWIVFGSANAVEIFCDHAGEWLVTRQPRIPKVAAIGPKTAQALQSRGLTADFIPDEYVAEAILPGLGNVKGKRVLLPRAEIARDVLPLAIRKAGGTAREVTIYQTLPAEADPIGLDELRSGVDFVTLTSPSTVDNFVSLARRSGLDPVNLPGEPFFLCIGQITEQAARQQGLKRLIVAAEHTTDGMIKALAQYVASQEVL